MELDESYYFRKLEPHQLENTVLNLERQHASDTAALHRLILDRYQTLT